MIQQTAHLWRNWSRGFCEREPHIAVQPIQQTWIELKILEGNQYGTSDSHCWRTNKLGVPNHDVEAAQNIQAFI